MALSSVLQIAQNSLANLTRNTGVIARNISESSNQNYSRREFQPTSSNHGLYSIEIRRAIDLRLERASIDATNSDAGHQVMVRGFETLQSSLSENGYSLTVTDRITELHDSVQTYSGNSDNEMLGEAAIHDAKMLVNSLREASGAIQSFRTGIDAEIAQTVKELNGFLAEFETANTEIVKGTMTGRDVNDALDRRLELLNQIAEIVPVSPMLRGSNDMVLYTASGTTLFEAGPRAVLFNESTALAPGVQGNPVIVDANQLSLNTQQSVSGKLDALVRLRDSLAPDLQSQLDETARLLILAFAESDATASGLPALQGLFSWSGGPGVPTIGATNALAGSISINADYDPSAGGNVTYLRDGGSNGAAYDHNPTGTAAFSGHLIELTNLFDKPYTTDPTLGMGDNLSLVNLSIRSGAWLAGKRADVSEAAELSNAKLSRVRESLLNSTGVNVDAEMSKLGELENGFQASARLLNVADQMLQSLLDAIG